MIDLCHFIKRFGHLKNFIFNTNKDLPLCRLKCPPGHWCTEGTRTQFEHPCSAGTFNKEIGLERQDQCLACLPGYYCPAGDQTGDKLCPAGHYCPDTPVAANAYPCPPGTYTEEQGAQSKFFQLLFDCEILFCCHCNWVTPAITLLVPIVIHIQFLPTITLPDQTDRSWELTKWSPMMKCCDVRTNSLQQYHKESTKNSVEKMRVDVGP